MLIARLPGVDLHYTDEGVADGPAIVFANSLGTDLRLWDDVVERLPVGVRVIRFDKRGHGLSSVPAGPYSVDDLVEDAAALLDRLGVTDCLFVGLSIGGLITQGLAARRPDLVRALVLSNTAALLGGPALWSERIAAIEAKGLASIADPIMERWFSAPFRETDAFVGWREMLLRTPEAGYIGCCHALAGADLRQSTAALTLPTLGIGGSVDGSTPPDLVRGTVESIAGARFDLIEGVGHLPCVEVPDTYAALLTDFMAQQGMG